MKVHCTAPIDTNWPTMLFTATGFKYAQQISEGILALQENGELTTLEKRWWYERRGGGACPVRFQLNCLTRCDSIFFMKKNDCHSISFIWHYLNVNFIIEFEWKISKNSQGQIWCHCEWHRIAANAYLKLRILCAKACEVRNFSHLPN